MLKISHKCLTLGGCNIEMKMEIYLRAREDVNNHAIASDRNESENTDGEAQKTVPQRIHWRKLVPKTMSSQFVMIIKKYFISRPFQLGLYLQNKLSIRKIILHF